MRASCSDAQAQPRSSPQARTAAAWLAHGGPARGGAKRPQEREEGLEKDVAPVGLLSEPLENRSMWSNPSRIYLMIISDLLGSDNLGTS